MQLTMKSERSDSGILELKYRLVSSQQFPIVDVENSVFSLTALQAKKILQQHIDMANKEIELIEEMEKAYSVNNSSVFEERHEYRQHPESSTDIVSTAREDRYMVTGDTFIKGTIGIITETDDITVELSIPFADKGIIFRLRKDQVSRIDDGIQCKVMMGGELFTSGENVRRILETLGSKPTFIHHYPENPYPQHGYSM